LKSKNPNIKVVAVEPAESAVISGEQAGPHKIQGIGAGFIPDNLNKEIIDEIIKVPSETAIQWAQRLCHEEGLMVGISSGAAVYAAIEVAKKPENKGKMIGVIIPSFGERYLSTMLFQDLLEECKSM
jgi:cysteine synthase